MDILVKIFPAGAMSACAGFRAFLPLFIVTYLIRSGNLGITKINPYVKPYLENEIIFYAIAALAVMEVLGDKLPSSASVMEILLMFIRPAAGVITAFTLMTLKEPNLNFILSVALGTFLTIPIQNMKSSAKILSEKGEFGMYNLTMSLAVDVEAFAGTVLAIVVPQVAFFVLPVVFYFTIESFKNWRVRLIAGQELDVEFDDGPVSGEEFLEIKQLKKIGKNN
jgi:hypothetical protein